MPDSLYLGQLDKSSAVHLIGIGGAGMSAIATVLLEMGYPVSGSDLKESANVLRLRGLGAAVGIGHRAENLGEARVVVRSSAIRADNPELLEAGQRGIPVLDRAQMLAAIMETRKGVAVAGTHGKTTTTSLVTQVLLSCGADPSYLIGGELNEIGGNAHYTEGDYLVAEADESDGSLLYLRPFATVLTNVDLDHPDYYESLEHTARVFTEFLRRTQAGGFAVVCGEDRPARHVGLGFRSEGGRVLFYGKAEANDYRFTGESIGADGNRFTVWYRDGELGGVRSGIAGLHNIYNSLAACALAHQLGFPFEEIARGIASFKGVRRRFETVGESAGIRVVDDYAHHPVEVEAVLGFARQACGGRIVAVFQPHRYSRTAAMAERFATSFTDADVVVVCDVYGAGEEPEPGVSGRLVADGITRAEVGKQVLYVPSRPELAAEVAAALGEGDTVITLGAGDVTLCAREILELLQEREGLRAP
ncbi:MAG: UDP-N-acetylmuramate--L-alanine ligase [Actinomycetota bacterium]